MNADTATLPSLGSCQKALDLLAENRVVDQDDPEDFTRWHVIVAGRHDHYDVYATDAGVRCSCPSQHGYCSHVLAAMVFWEEAYPE